MMGYTFIVGDIEKYERKVMNSVIKEVLYKVHIYVRKDTNDQLIFIPDVASFRRICERLNPKPSGCQ